MIRAQETETNAELNNDICVQRLPVLDENSHRGRGATNRSLVVNERNLRNFATSLQSPMRKGQLTLSSPRTCPSRRGIDINRRQKLKERIASSAIEAPPLSSSVSVRNRTRNNNNSNALASSFSVRDKTRNKVNKTKSEEVILFCPKNYDDDISSISDVFTNSRSKRRESREGKGQEVSFFPGSRHNRSVSEEEASLEEVDDDSTFVLPEWCESRKNRNIKRLQKNHSADAVLLPPQRKRDEQSQYGGSFAAASRGQDEAYIPIISPRYLPEAA